MSVSSSTTTTVAAQHDDVIYPSTIPFVLVHVACLAVFWTGVRPIDVAACVLLYYVRMFWVTAGYHRYFSHKSFKTSRLGQFVLAFLAQSSAQRGIIWWAATHREHHKYSDTPLDVHSPRQHGLWRSHVGWIFTKRRSTANYDLVPDLLKYPELRLLNDERMKYIPAAVLGFLVWLALGWSGFVVVFLFGTVLLYHGSFSINSLAHVYGNQRYVTGDDSRNNWWLAIITTGEGWHNNHHFYQSSTRQGFFWWEYDPTYYALKFLSWFGLVWDVCGPPKHVLTGEKRLSRNVVEKVARQLAFSFPIERIVEQASEAWSHAPSLHEVRTRARDARAQLEKALVEYQLPALPTIDELRDRAREMFAQTPSLDEIVQRARQILLETVSAQLVEQPKTA